MIFFDYNAHYLEAWSYLYQDFPTAFTWVLRSKEWKPRQKNFQISRMYQANLFQSEVYYLRQLLTVVRGLTSFENLHTVNDVLQPTFEAACRARGIINHESE
jgi:hypothetical protein